MVSELHELFIDEVQPGDDNAAGQPTFYLMDDANR
jgi:hypothetical protein